MILYEQTEGASKDADGEMEYTGKGLLDIKIIRKMMEMEEALINDPDYQNFCLARRPLEGETEVVCDPIEGMKSGARMLVMGSDWRTMTQEDLENNLLILMQG